MDNPSDHGSAWWRFAIAAGAIAFGASFATGASEWWEFATIAVMGLLAVFLVVSGVRSLIARRHRERDDS